MNADFGWFRCLMARWDEFEAYFEAAGARVTFE
jgi:hypothetical protein